MQAKKQSVISDPEFIEQFADDPEALAVLDAIAATQSPNSARAEPLAESQSAARGPPSLSR